VDCWISYRCHAEGRGQRFRGKVRTHSNWNSAMFIISGVIFIIMNNVAAQTDSHPQIELNPRRNPVSEYFKSYCSVTARHGVRYLAEDRRYFVKRSVCFDSVTHARHRAWHDCLCLPSNSWVSTGVTKSRVLIMKARLYGGYEFWSWLCSRGERWPVSIGLWFTREGSWLLSGQ